MESKKFLKIAISTGISIVAFIMSFLNENSSLLFSIEIAAITFIFMTILIIPKDHFSPLMFVFINFFISVLDIIFVALKIRIVQPYYDIAMYEKTLGIVLVWVIGFIVGFLIAGKGKKKNKNEDISRDGILSNKANINLILILSVIIYAYAAIKIIITIFALGGVDAAMTNSAVFRYNNQAYLDSILLLSSIIPICLFEKKYNKTGIFVTVLMAGLIFLIGRRGLMITGLIIPLVAYFNYRKGKIAWKKILLYGGICIIFILFIGNLRGQSSATDSNNFITKMATSLTSSRDIGRILPDTLYALEQGRIEYGNTKYMFNGVLGMVPRAMWPDKPKFIDHSTIIGYVVYNESKYGQPIGPFGFSYYCFGMVGVIASALISGFLSRKMYNWMLKGRSFIHIFIYSVGILSVIRIVLPEAQMSLITLFVITLASFGLLKLRLRTSNRNIVKKEVGVYDV